MLQEFREFAMRGSVVDLAVGVIIGAAFGKIVDSLVRDVIMPPIGLLPGKVDFSNLFLVMRDGLQAGPYATVEAAATAPNEVQAGYSAAGSYADIQLILPGARSASGRAAIHQPWGS